MAPSLTELADRVAAETRRHFDGRQVAKAHDNTTTLAAESRHLEIVAQEMRDALALLVQGVADIDRRLRVLELDGAAELWAEIRRIGEAATDKPSP